MAAPTLTARTTPVGIALQEGFPVKIAFAADPDISIWELGLKPAGIDNGDPIDVTTQWNALGRRTKSSRALSEDTNANVRYAYDPAARSQLRAICGVEGSVTEYDPDGSTATYFGYLKNADFDEMTDGTRPEGNSDVVVTNWDPVARVEALPVFVSVAGT